MTSDPFTHFVNLWLLSLLLVPVFYALRSSASREWLLAAAGAYLIFITGMRFLIFWVAYWFMIYGLARLLHRSANHENERLLMGIAITIALLPLVLWKLYGESFLFPVNQFLHNVISFIPQFAQLDPIDSGILVPLGMSYACFRAMDLLAAIFLGLMEPPSLRRMFFYGLFPPVLVLGPIIQYKEIADAPLGPADQSGLISGLYRVVIGLAKLYVLARPLAFSQDVLSEHAQYGVLTLWGAVVVQAWYFYLNFSAYSDMAIGSARLFGYRIAENFSFPYFRENLQQFWAHWHMSLTGLAQRLIFVPLGGYRKNRQYLAVFLTMMVIALWHDISIPLISFGIVHGFALIALRWWGQRRARESTKPNRLRVLVGTGLTFMFVAVTLPLLILDPASALVFYQHLFFGIV